jgi:hypothetical protein
LLAWLLAKEFAHDAAESQSPFPSRSPCGVFTQGCNHAASVSVTGRILFCIVNEWYGETPIVVVRCGNALACSISKLRWGRCVMSGESRRPALAPSSENIGTIVPRNLALQKFSKFGRVVVALWPHKPALNLAQRAGLSERGAQYLIDGKRKPNARAALAVYAEIIG